MSTNKPPKAFISYSWESDKHAKWVKQLGQDLISNGIDVTLDIFEMKPGSNMKLWMEESERNADFVIPVFTENYTKKANERSGGVGFEYGLIIQTLYENMADNEKIIPIVKRYNKKKDEVLPKFIRQYWYVDFSNKKEYRNRFEELLRVLHGEPKHIKPKIGNKPKFR